MQSSLNESFLKKRKANNLAVTPQPTTAALIFWRQLVRSSPIERVIAFIKTYGCQSHYHTIQAAFLAGFLTSILKQVLPYHQNLLSSNY
jgi:hypothetical protein